MEASLKRRLDRIESAIQPPRRHVAFKPLKGENNEDVAARMERWYAGEMVDGVDIPYTGNEGVWHVVVIDAVDGKPTEDSKRWMDGGTRRVELAARLEKYEQ